MQPRHHISRSAIEITKQFEGYRRRAAQLPDGRWTIGYGHTRTARAGAEVSEEDAEALLMYDMTAVAHAVNTWTYAPLTQNQFDALCAFTFNIGLDNFRTSSVLRRVNEGQLLKAACAMELWRKADFEGERIVIDALVRRRSAEKTLFLTPTEGWVPAPSPILRPNLDLDVPGCVPEQTPTALTAAMEGARAVAQRDEAPAPSPVRPEEEEGPSPTQVAAAALTARLSTLFPEPEPETESEAASSLEQDAVASKPAAAEPAALDEPWPLERMHVVTPAPANDSEPTPAEPAAPEPMASDAPFAPAPPVRATVADGPHILGVSVLASLAAGGLGLIALGLILAANARGGAGDAGPFVGWLVGIAGIGLFAFAAYLLLDRLGHAGDDLDS